MLAYFPTWAQNDAAYQADVRTAFGTNADAVLAKYPSANFPTVQNALQRVMTDSRHLCPTRSWLRSAAAHTQTWRYLYKHTYDSGPEIGEGAGHAMELPFIFHDFGLADVQPDAAELQLRTRTER